MGLTSLKKWQLGEEATKGTAVAAEVMMQGTASYVEASEVKRRLESLGLMMPEGGGFYIPKVLAGLDTEADATFEQLPIYLNTCIEDEAGTQDGTTGSGYIYTHDFPETAARTVNTATLEYGDDTQAHECSYAFCQSMSISWAGGQNVQISANWLGRIWSETTFTSLSTMTTEGIYGCEFSFNAPGTAFNAEVGDATMTLRSNTLLAYTLTLNPMVPVWTGDQTSAEANSGKWFGYAKQRGLPEGIARLELTCEHNANGNLLYDAFRANTIYKYQIIHQGSSITQGDGSYSYKKFDIGCFMVIDTCKVYEDQDGDTVITVSGPLVYDDATDDDAGRIVVINEKADVYA